MNTFLCTLSINTVFKLLVLPGSAVENPPTIILVYLNFSVFGNSISQNI